MTQEAENVPAASVRAQTARQLQRRWLGLGALLLAEYFGVSLSFDAGQLLERSGVSSALGYLGIIAPIGVVIAASVYLLAGERLRGEALALITQHGASKRLWPWLAANAFGYAALFAITQTMVAVPFETGALPWGSVAGFLVALSVTVGALVPAALPRAAIVPLLRRMLRVIGLGVGAGALAWAAGVASGELYYTLRDLTLRTVHMLVAPFAGNALIYQPDVGIIGVGTFYVEVAPVCSGFEGIGLIIVFTAIYLRTARDQLRFPRAWGLLPLAIVAVWIGNAVRIALLVAVGVFISPQIALSGFHSKAGWLFFVAIALGLIAMAQRSEYFLREPPPRATQEEDAHETWNPTATYLAPLLALIATTLVTGLASAGFDYFYVLRVLAVLGALYVYRDRLPEPSWPPSWHAPLIGVVVFVLWLALVPHGSADALATYHEGLAGLTPAERAFWLGARVFGSSVTVPIAEELAFRAFLLRRLISSDFIAVPKTQLTPIALVVSSVAFGLLHGGAWIGGIVAGVAYAWAQRARGRTSDAVIAHAVTNALICVDVLAFGADWLWV